MTYYRSGTNKTLQLDWFGGKLSHGRHIFYANQIIGKEFGPRAWENSTSAVEVNGEYNGTSCCGFQPSNGGILQYRAYGCLPMNYNQLMRGVLITPGQRWSTVKNALNIRPANRGGYIVIIAFFIPTVNDRNRRRLRPTFSPPAGGSGNRIVLAPACTPSLWGPSNCTVGIQDPGEHFGIDRIRKPCHGNSILWQS